MKQPLECLQYLLVGKYLTLPKGTWLTLGYAPFQNMMVAYYSGPKVNKCNRTNLLGKQILTYSSKVLC